MSTDTALPPLTQQPIMHVDCTPDKGYPIRILEAYLHDSCCNWEVHGLHDAAARVYEMMNEDNSKRHAILSRAIETLQASERSDADDA